MQHIFFLHSNICIIVAFQTIKQLIENKEKVTIILNRGTKFPFFEGEVKLIDIQYITDEYRKLSSNVFTKFCDYRFNYLPHFDDIAKDIIANNDFILYAPSYNQFTLRSFFKSLYLQGYYYLEEGTMSYVSDVILKKRYFKKLFLKGRIFSRLLGVKEYYDYKVTNKFKGVICLSIDAFPWLKEKKINSIDDYLSSVEENPLSVDAFIVTGYLYEDIYEIYRGLNLIFEHVMMEDRIRKVAVKFHPTAVSYNKMKCGQIMDYIKKQYSTIEVVFVNPSYPVESSLYKSKTILYSIFGMSSLCLYSLILGSKSYVIENGTSMTITEINNVNEFLLKANAL